MKKLIFVIIVLMVIVSCNKQNSELGNNKVCDVSIEYNCLDNQSEVMLVGFIDFTGVDADSYEGLQEIGVLYCPENQTFQIKNQNVTMCY